METAAFAQLADAVANMEEVQAQPMLNQLLGMCPAPLPSATVATIEHRNPMLPPEAAALQPPKIFPQLTRQSSTLPNVQCSKKQLAAVVALVTIHAKRSSDVITCRISRLLPGYLRLLSSLKCSATSEWFAYEFTSQLLVSTSCHAPSPAVVSAFIESVNEVVTGSQLQSYLDAIDAVPGINNNTAFDANNFATLCGLLAAITDAEQHLHTVLGGSACLTLASLFIAIATKMATPTSDSKTATATATTTSTTTTMFLQQLRSMFLLAAKACAAGQVGGVLSDEWSGAMRQLLICAENTLNTADLVIKAAAFQTSVGVAAVMGKARGRVFQAMLATLKSACEKAVTVDAADVAPLGSFIHILINGLLSLSHSHTGAADAGKDVDTAMTASLLEVIRDCILTLVMGARVDESAAPFQQLRFRKFGLSAKLRPLVLQAARAGSSGARASSMPEENNQPTPYGQTSAGFVSFVKEMLEGGLSACLSMELRGTAYVARFDSPTLETSPVGEPFESSTSRTVVYSLVRELHSLAQSARDFVLAGSRWLMPGMPTSSSRKESATSSKIGESALRAQALIVTLRKVCVAVDIPEVTQLVASSLLELYTSEREWHMLHDPKGILKAAPSSNSKNAGTILEPARADSGQGLFSRIFGAAAKGGATEEPPAQIAPSDPSAQATLLHVICRTLAEFSCLGSNKLLFDTIFDTLGSHVVQAASVNKDSVISAAVPQAFATMAASLWIHTSTLKSLQARSLQDSYVAHEYHTWENRRSELRNRVMVVASQVGNEISSTASKTTNGKELVDPSILLAKAEILISMLPALAHAVLPSDDRYLVESSAQDVDGAYFHQVSTDNTAGLLPAYSRALPTNYHVPVRSNPSAVKIYRNLWANFLLLRVFDAAHNSRSVFHALRTFALYTPVLVVKMSSSYIDMDLSSSAFLRQAIADHVVAESREALVTLFADLREAVLALSTPHVIYVRTVLALEQLRASGGTLKAVFHYLEDGAIEREGLVTMISAVCDSAFRHFCMAISRTTKHSKREANLLDHCLFLLAHCGHRYGRVRTAAYRYLVDLLDRFPQLLWDRSSLSALLDIIDAIGTRAVRGTAPPARAGTSGTSQAAGGTDPLHESTPLRVPSCPYPVSASWSGGDLADILNDFIELAARWLYRAAVAAPEETRVGLRNYLARLAVAQSKLHGVTEARFGLAAALHGAASSQPQDAIPAVRPYGMFSRLRFVATAVTGKAIPVDVAAPQLYQGGTRFRWGQRPTEQNNTSTSTSYSANAQSRSHLGGFYASAWAASVNSNVLAPVDMDRSPEDDSSSIFLDTVSVATRRSRTSGRASRVGKPIVGNEPARLYMATSGSAIAATKYLLSAGSQYDQSKDSLSLLNAELAPMFSLSHERQSYYAGQISGMAAMHAVDFSGSHRSGQAFEHVMKQYLRKSFESLLSISHQRLRQAIGEALGNVKADGQHKVLHSINAISEAVGVIPAEAIPAIAHELHKSDHGGLHLSRRGNAAVLFDADTSSSDEDGPRRQVNLQDATKPQVLPPSARRGRSVEPSHRNFGFYFSRPATLGRFFRRNAKSNEPDLAREGSQSLPPLEGQDQAMGSYRLRKWIKSFRESLSEKKTARENVDAAIVDTLYRTAAFLCWLFGSSTPSLKYAHQKEVISDLLPLFVWVPARNFSEAVMIAATESWSWVLAACPQLRVTLLGEIAAAWQWTIDSQYGLFSASLYKQSPDRPTWSSYPVAAAVQAAVAPLACDSNPLPEDVLGAPAVEQMHCDMKQSLTMKPVLPFHLCNVNCHESWIDFWEAQFRTSRTRSADELTHIVKSVMSGVKDPSKLSTSPAAFSGRFKLTHLALVMLQQAVALTTEYSRMSEQHARPRTVHPRDDLGSRTGRAATDSARLRSAFGSVSRFRECILQSALNWFESAPVYYETVVSASKVRADFPYIISICRMLIAERKPSNGGMEDGRLSAGKRASVILAAQTDEDVDSPLRSDRTQRVPKAPGLQRGKSAVPVDLRRLVLGRLPSYGSPDTRPMLSPVSQTAATPRVRASTFGFSADLELSRADTDALNYDTVFAMPISSVHSDSLGTPWTDDLRELLVLFLSHEIDRIVAWHNPNDLEERHLPDEKEFSFDARLSANAVKEGEWLKHAQTAWAASPTMALRLLKRFPRIPELRTALHHLVLTDPTVLRDDPEAVSLLVTPENVAMNAPQLRHLLSWAPTSMATVLSFLSRCSHEDASLRPRGVPMFAHPLVSAYVVRCLRRFSADAIVFYLPQLVQALRHDTNGQLADFLFATSQTSMLVSHQLIWLLVSESRPDVNDKHAHRPVPVSEGSVQYVSELSLSPNAEDSNGNVVEETAGQNHGFQKQIKGADTLPAKATALTNRIISTYPPTARSLFELQYSFWDSVTNISGRLKTEVVDPTQRKSKIKQFLKDLQHSAERDAITARHRLYRQVQQDLRELAKDDTKDKDAAMVHDTAIKKDMELEDGRLLESGKGTAPLAGAVAVLGGKVDLTIYAASAPGKEIAEPNGAGAAANGPGLANQPQLPHSEVPDIIDVVYLPTAPNLRLVSVDLDSGRPMQSASKCPFLLTFEVERYQGPDSTLRKQERREERRRREQAKMSSHARSAALAKALKARTKTSTMTKARVAAQTAASAVRRKVQLQRVQVGLSLERTRRQVAHGISKRRREVANSVNQVVRSLTVFGKGGVAESKDGDETQVDESKLEGQIGHSSHEHEDDGAGLGLSEDADSLRDRSLSETSSLASAGDIAYLEAEGMREDSGDEGSVADHAVVPSSPIVSPVKAMGGPAYPAIDKGMKLSALGIGRRRRKGKKAHDLYVDAEDAALPLRSRVPTGPPATLRSACIFKVYDDCRQDALVLQVIQVFKHVFERADLGLMLYPYRVLPTRSGPKRIPGGILEVIPDVKSRDEIGKAGFPNLYDYFISTYGRPDGPEFEAARRNLIRSLAAYSVICYLMWIKDRHNGNLLVTSTGAVIHIDFGFVLGITPGGNLGFETAAFKLTQEFLNIMGGSTDTESFDYFSELVSRSFLLAREQMDVVMSLVSGMADSGLPCYLFPDTLSKLAHRFRPEDNDLRACRYMRSETLAAANRMTTILYDGIQKLQNNIHSETWQ